MHETCTSFCEEEADFLTELLVKQVCSSPACCCSILYIAARVSVGKLVDLAGSRFAANTLVS